MKNKSPRLTVTTPTLKRDDHNTRPSARAWAMLIYHLDRATTGEVLVEISESEKYTITLSRDHARAAWCVTNGEKQVEAPTSEAALRAAWAEAARMAYQIDPYLAAGVIFNARQLDRKFHPARLIDELIGATHERA